MAVNNIYYVDMEKRYRDFQEETVDMRNLHPIDKDTEDSIKSRLVAALFKFRFDGQAT